MENIVALKVTSSAQESGFLTWGRVLAQEELVKTLRANLSQFGITAVKQIILCNTLQEVALFPYFHEGLFYFCQEPIPFGPQYENWCKEKENTLKQGGDIYFVGSITC